MGRMFFTDQYFQASLMKTTSQVLQPDWLSQRLVNEALFSTFDPGGSGSTFMLSLLRTLALLKMPKGILLMRLCSMLRE